MIDLPFWIYILIAIVAFLYASVGHGGASGYLAVLSLVGVSSVVMKPSALLLNIVVSAVSFILFSAHKYFRFSLFWPFAITSIPMAYLGALIPIQETYYKKILALCLFFAIVWMFFKQYVKNDQPLQPICIYQALVAGALVGVLSGMIGIGGGIILSPLILILRWGTVKESAAVSALFIWVNSVAGFSALYIGGVLVPEVSYYLLLIAFPMGVMGAYYGSKVFNNKVLTYLLITVLLIAAIKLALV